MATKAARRKLLQGMSSSLERVALASLLCVHCALIIISDQPSLQINVRQSTSKLRL